MDTAIVDTSALPSSVLPDYSSQIRAQIEEEVKGLKDKLENKRYSADYYSTYNIAAQYVHIGYIINSHHGRELFSEGDIIEGVSVKLDRNNPRSITVCADDVEFKGKNEEKEEDDYGEMRYVTKVRCYRENISESTTW